MSNLNEEEIAEIMENGNVGEIVVPYGDGITDYLTEWENLIEELSVKEVLLYKKKEAYQVMSDKIIAETNFKELYGKNNESVRKNHVKHELSDIVSELKTLEFSINYIKRRISFLKQLIHTKTVLLEVKKWK